MTDANVTFIAPLAAARVPAGLFAGLDRAAATPVDYIAERDEDKLPWRRGLYRVAEDIMTLPGRRKKDPVHQLRRILVYSSVNAGAAGKARALKLAQARTELDTLTRTAGARYHPTAEAVKAKATEIACTATRTNPSSNAATATSKAPSPSRRCSCATTGVSPH
jgi:hypothetical protein